MLLGVGVWGMASATLEKPVIAEPAPRRRNQWGRDRRSRAMPMVPKPVSDTRVAMARLAIIVTVSAWVGYLVSWFFEDFFKPGYESALARTEAVLYLLIVTMLTVSALAYLLSRLGFFYRTRTHHRASRAVLDQFYETTSPSLTTIIPSYQEEARVIRNTLLSAALQEYPGEKRVVLLIDDPYVPKSVAARDQLMAARALPGEIQRLLAEPADRCMRALRGFELGCERGEPLGIGSMIALASHYDEAAKWLERLAADLEITDHTDAFFANEVLLRLAESLRTIMSALLDSTNEGAVLNAVTLRRLYRRLVSIFRVSAEQFRAQALRVAVARAQQGDEPQQLPRPDGRVLSRGTDRDRHRAGPV